MSGYMPLGAANDPDAPYNERMIRERRLVTVTFQYWDWADINEGASEEEIKEEFRRTVKRNGVPNSAEMLEFDIE